MGLGPLGNQGIEGITYDSLNDCFYAVQEGTLSTNMAVYRVTTNGGVSTIEIFDAEKVFRDSGLCDDMSDVTYDPFSGHLFILSDMGESVFGTPAIAKVPVATGLCGNSLLAKLSLENPFVLVAAKRGRDDYFQLTRLIHTGGQNNVLKRVVQ